MSKPPSRKEELRLARRGMRIAKRDKDMTLEILYVDLVARLQTMSDSEFKKEWEQWQLPKPWLEKEINHG